jgi:hypothetical protein
MSMDSDLLGLIVILLIGVVVVFMAMNRMTRL